MPCHVGFERWPPPGSFDPVHGAFDGAVPRHQAAVGFLHDVGSEAKRGVEKIADLAKPSIDIGGETGLLLGH